MIPPGGEGEIKVTLRPKGTHIDIDKKIVVYSNDPEQPRFTLTMKGTLLVDVVAQPPSVMFRDLARGKGGVETFSVQPTEGSTVSIESFRVEDTDSFSIRRTEALPGMLATYEVRFEGTQEIGISSTNVVVETTGENTPELIVPVRASTTFNLRYPKRFGFSSRDGEVYERTIRISTRRGGPPKIRKVVDPDELLDVEILEPEAAATSIQMTLRKGALEKAGEGTWHTLFVHTDDRDEPELELQYRVAKRRTPGQAVPRGSKPEPGQEPPQASLQASGRAPPRVSGQEQTPSQAPPKAPPANR